MVFFGNGLLVFVVFYLVLVEIGVDGGEVVEFVEYIVGRFVFKVVDSQPVG